MADKHDGRMGNLPANINSVIPDPKPDAQTITQLVKHGGKVDGYRLSNGKTITKEEGVELAKAGEMGGKACRIE